MYYTLYFNSQFRGKRSTTDTCTVRTVVGDEYTFQSPNADDITNLIVMFLEGLKKRSRYLVAIKSQKGDGKCVPGRKNRKCFGFREEQFS